MQKAWQAWTFVDFGQKKVWPRRSRSRGGDATDCAGVGFGAIRAGGFLPVKAAGGHNIVAGVYFRGRGACAQYDPKVMLGAKTLDPEGDAFYGSEESSYVNPKWVCVCKILDHEGDL